MTNKILFFDIDGTIYREGFGLPENTAEALNACVQNGHKLLLCTGRGYSSIPAAVRELPFQGGVYACGTHVMVDDRVLVDAVVQGTDCRKIIDILYRNKCPFFVNNSDYIYYDPDYYPEGFDKIIQRMVRDYRGKLQPLHKLPDRLSKLTAYPRFNSLIPRIAQELSPWFDLIEHPQYAYIELVLRGYTKGTGVELAMRELGLDQDDAYGFGDSDNDVPMLDAVGHGVVMAEAPEELRSRYSCAGALQEDGLAKVLRELGLA